MRKPAFFLAILCLLATGCVISPRRTVGSSSGGGSSNSEFSLSVNPTTQTITAGAAGIYTVNIQAVNGFTGTVNLSASSSSPGLVATFDNTSITSGNGSASLSVQTQSTTTAGTSTITVFASDPNNSVSQSLSVTATVQTAAASIASAIVPAGVVVQSGCVSAPAGSGIQRASFPANPGADAFTATFAVTPSTVMDATLGFFAPASSAVPPALSQFINFSPAGELQVGDGDVFITSSLPYAAGSTYLFRLQENLPAATYSVFVTPPDGTEIQLGVNLQVPPGQRGATGFTGLGVQVNAPDAATLSVCRFSLQ
jgi:hypothetical protein